MLILTAYRDSAVSALVIIAGWVLNARPNITRIVERYWFIYPLTNRLLEGSCKYFAMVKPRGH